MKRFMCLAIALLAGVGHAYAAETAVTAPQSGGYAALGAGINFFSGGDARFINQTPQAVKFSEKMGPAFSLSGGYRWASGLRTEAEVTYRRNTMKEYNNGAVVALSGAQQDITAMANVLYDINTNSRLTPYIGAGIGMSMIRWNKVATPTSIGPIVIARGGTRLAYQGILGVAYAVSPGVQLTLDGRYKGATGFHFQGVLVANSIADLKVGAMTVMAGVRFAF